MPFTAPALATALAALIPTLTVHLHTGDPGAAGTTNRVPSTSIGSATIPSPSGFNLQGNTATAADDLDFGTASAAVSGVSWMSVFNGNSYWARRELAAPMDVANGAAVVVTASTFVFAITSTDT